MSENDNDKNLKEASLMADGFCAVLATLYIRKNQRQILRWMSSDGVEEVRKSLRKFPFFSQEGFQLVDKALFGDLKGRMALTVSSYNMLKQAVGHKLGEILKEAERLGYYPRNPTTENDK